MNKVYVRDLVPNREYETFFFVSSKSVAHTRNGKPYLTVRLTDKTGDVVGRIWDDALNMNKLFAAKDIISVRARCEDYQGNLQLIISMVKRLDAGDVDPAHFLPETHHDTSELWDRLEQLIGAVENRHLRELLEQFVKDVDLSERFKKAPAAKSLHHAYLGGLLEHTLSVCELLLKVCDHYPELDRDLLFTAGVFHDIGKVDELTYDVGIDYTEVGRLLGHVILGNKIIDEMISRVTDFPAELAILLKHMMISHHGYLEFGSVKRPKTREAFALYFIDDLDAKMGGLNRLLDMERESDSLWTGYSKTLERFIFKGWPEKTKTEGQRRKEDKSEENGDENPTIFSFL